MTQVIPQNEVIFNSQLQWYKQFYGLKFFVTHNLKDISKSADKSPVAQFILSDSRELSVGERQTKTMDSRFSGDARLHVETR